MYNFSDNSRDHPAPIIKAVDHNQEVFEGGNTNLRCILPGAKDVNYINVAVDNVIGTIFFFFI